MQRVEVSPDRLGSQFFKAYQYDELGQTLEIEFADGRRCVHSRVPADLYRDFHESREPGRFWAAAIRDASKDGQPSYPMRMVS